MADAVVMTAGMMLLGAIDAHTSVLTLSLFTAVVGEGMLMQNREGMLMQNLVLAAQNFGPAATGGAAMVPGLATLPPEVLVVVRQVYGLATRLRSRCLPCCFITEKNHGPATSAGRRR